MKPFMVICIIAWTMAGMDGFLIYDLIENPSVIKYEFEAGVTAAAIYFTITASILFADHIRKLYVKP